MKGVIAYETRDGIFWAEILRDNLNSTFPIVALLTHKETKTQHIGHYRHTLSSAVSVGHDLVPYDPAKHWAVDEKVEVSDDKIKWTKRYFAKFENGVCWCWEGGTTSFTQDGIVQWQFYRKWDGEA